MIFNQNLIKEALLKAMISILIQNQALIATTHKKI
jgi:hypothetical protein